MVVEMTKRVRNTVLALALAWALGASAGLAQVLPVVEPDAVGMSTARLERITEMARRRIDEGKLVGAVTLVARDGKIVHSRSIGHADVETDRPLAKDTIFRIYSMTKPITSVAAMILYEEGRFQLGDPVHWYLPELRNVMVHVDGKEGGGDRVAPRRPITIRDLLAHKSGLTYGFFGDSEVDRLYGEADVLDESGTTADMVEKLGDLPLRFHPGERWHYSVSTDVLGRLVEVLSGSTLDEFFRRRIFEPLGMSDTGFSVPDEKLERFPVNYRWDRSGERRIADHPSRSRYRRQPTFHSGGGGLVSTASDYLRFCQMLLDGGRLGDVRLLSPKTVALMTMNHLDDAKIPTSGVQLGDGAGFGFGFRVVTDEARSHRLASRGTYGWGGMASTMFFVDPRERLIGIIMTQKLPTDLRLRDDFETAVYQAITASYDR